VLQRTDQTWRPVLCVSNIWKVCKMRIKKSCNGKLVFSKQSGVLICIQGCCKSCMYFCRGGVGLEKSENFFHLQHAKILGIYLDILLEILKRPPSLQWLLLCHQLHTGPMLFLPLHTLRMPSLCSFQQPENNRLGSILRNMTQFKEEENKWENHEIVLFGMHREKFIQMRVYILISQQC